MAGVSVDVHSTAQEVDYASGDLVASVGAVTDER